ncbi:MAG: hypothetical protein JO142_05750 [Burkholderiales bacterium]|nr:hypothetical protein [Burkholderiales bacterium]
MKNLIMGALLALTSAIALAAPPAPRLDASTDVDWWFAFKFNATAFPGCATGAPANSCIFGGDVQSYRSFSQQFAYASSNHPTLVDGSDCIGTTTADPVGATFDEIYNGNNYYVVWNDQFYNDPSISSCGTSCSAPWGHSKGVLSWDDSGAGVIMQVTTPSWPASGSASSPRQSDGNTLGCVADDNVMYSQHFFALRLSKSDVAAVLQALATASVVTDPSNPQIVNNGGPADIQNLVNQLGSQSSTTLPLLTTLSTGVTLIAKPSALHVPPWQMVSSLLGGVPLRVASWWEDGKTSVDIPSTTTNTHIACWDSSLEAPGAVQIATTGAWDGATFKLTGGIAANHNHAKIGVSLDSKTPLAIFGDMNQEGALSGNCALSQNGRGGMFFAVPDAKLAQSVSTLLAGQSAASAR